MPLADARGSVGLTEPRPSGSGTKLKSPPLMQIVAGPRHLADFEQTSFHHFYQSRSG